MKKRILTLLLLLGPGGFAFAQGGESSTNATPVFQDGGNTWRVTFTSATAQMVLVSSRPENATVQGSSKTVSENINMNRDLGNSVWRERYITNTCTAAAVALYPAPINPRVFPSTPTAVILSSAGAPTSGGNNLYYGMNPIRFQVTHQDEIWAIWDAAGDTAGSPRPPCAGGLVVEEQYFREVQPGEKRRR